MRQAIWSACLLGVLGLLRRVAGKRMSNQGPWEKAAMRRVIIWGRSVEVAGRRCSVGGGIVGELSGWCLLGTGQSRYTRIGPYGRRWKLRSR